mgnify:FL=1
MIEIVKKNIKEQIKAKRMTAQEVCKIMNVSDKFIYRMTDEVKANKIVRIAQAIGCTTSDLMKGI